MPILFVTCYLSGFQWTEGRGLQILYGTRLIRTIQGYWEKINIALQYTIFRTNDAVFDWFPGPYRPLSMSLRYLHVEELSHLASRRTVTEQQKNHPLGGQRDAERDEDGEVKKRWTGDCSSAVMNKKHICKAPYQPQAGNGDLKVALLVFVCSIIFLCEI